MADSKISALSAQTTLAATDMLLVANAGSTTKKITAANLKLDIQIPTARAKYGGVIQYTMPGVIYQGLNTKTTSPGRASYYPFVVETAITIDQIVFELVTGVVGSTVRFGLYGADTDWQPTTLVTNTDTGDLTATAAQQGVIATTITDTALAPGRYLGWSNQSTGNHVYRSYRANMTHLLGVPVAMGGTNSQFAEIYVAQTYGAPPSTALAWSSASVNTFFDHPMLLRVKTP